MATFKQRRRWYENTQNAKLFRSALKQSKQQEKIKRLGATFHNPIKNIAKMALSQMPSFMVGGARSISSSNEYGYLFADLNKMVKKGNRFFLDDKRIDDVMFSILEDAKGLAPIDKRYIKAKKPNLKMTITMPSFKNVDERAKKRVNLLTSKEYSSGRALSKYLGGGGGYVGLRDAEQSQLSYEQMVFPEYAKKNNYSYEKQRALKRLTQKNKEVVRRLWYNQKTGTKDQPSIEIFNAGRYGTLKKSIPFATRFGDNKPHGGEEELRRSGEYDPKTKIISFDPTRLGTKYNYAAMQHNRLDFQHSEGQALFLRTAYINKRRLLVDTINTVIQEKLSQGITAPPVEKSKKVTVKDIKAGKPNIKARINRAQKKITGFAVRTTSSLLKKVKMK